MPDLEIKARQSDKGIEILFMGNVYTIHYPDNIWRDYPEEAKKVLFDNLVYSETIHLPLTLKEKNISYDTSPPLFRPYFFENMAMDFPSCADVDRTLTSGILKDYMNLQLRFKDSDVKLPTHVERTRSDSSVVSLSFGKDSLCSWAVAREIGLNPQTCYIVEPSLTYEEKHKTVLAEAFHKEFGIKLNKIEHSAGNLRDGVHLGVGKTEIGWGLQSTQYALMILPVAHRFQARYIIFGNEQSCKEYYFDREGYICYPAYDQSHRWTIYIDAMTRQVTGGGVRTTSVIEPLNDIAVVYTLYKRYPEVAKYHMSCFVETESGRDRKWCQDCSVCSKMHLLITASGFDPGIAGIERNMLESDCINYFSLFGGTSVETYMLTDLGRDEQLFAFYLAWKNGNRSGLVREFEKRFLQEAKDREEELHKKFFGLHESITIPSSIRGDVMSIYKEVLAGI